MASSTRNISVGIERVLYAAASDSAFRESLLKDRQGALKQRGIELLDSEQALLLAIPGVQLEASIDSLDVSPTNVERRRFLGAVALSSVSVAVGVGCGEEASQGIRPGDGGLEDVEVHPEGMSATGIRPEAGPADQGPVKDGWATPDSAGIRPKD